MTVRKAVIPAAGLGTRFLPATKAQPKEMLPLVDKPLIQYGVEEAVQSGIDNIIIEVDGGEMPVMDGSSAVFVDAIEQGDEILAEALVRSHVEALKRRMPHPEAAILGCTHYPLLEKVIATPEVKPLMEANYVMVELVAMENGKPLLIDEIALIDPRVMAVVYGVMDGRKRLDASTGGRGDSGWHHYVAGSAFDEDGWRDLVAMLLGLPALVKRGLSAQLAMQSLLTGLITLARTEEGARGAERLVAHVLHAGAVQMGEVVMICVIEIQPVGDRDVHAVEAGIEMHGEVGRVRQKFVHRCHHRV